MTRGNLLPSNSVRLIYEKEKKLSDGFLPHTD